MLKNTADCSGPPSRALGIKIKSVKEIEPNTWLWTHNDGTSFISNIGNIPNGKIIPILFVRKEN